MSARARFARLAAALLALAAAGAQAGGPLSFCNDAGKTPLKYNPATVNLNYDQGTLGSRTKAQADALVTSSVAMWTNVATATITIGRGGDLPTDVTTANQATYIGGGTYGDGLNPVVYDTDGSIIDALLGVGNKSSVLGFAGSAYYLAPTCRFAEGRAVINGYIGVDDTTMSVVLAHEIGHLIGMDHTQLDSEQGLRSSPPSNYPLMYPVAYRDTADLHEDDVAAVSALYPGPTLDNVYGQLSGTFVLANGTTPVLGANIWAKETTTNKLYSIVSDYLMQGTGYFKLLLPPGTYNLRAGAIKLAFDGGSSVGPYSEDSSGLSFQSPLYSGTTPMATVTLGNASPTAITIVAGCEATVTFRMNGAGTVGGDCVQTAPPDAPTIGTATAGLGLVSVTFTPGNLNGGTLVNHQVTCAGPADAFGASSPLVVAGLTAGTPYTCRARTTTNVGTSAWSAYSNSATPTGAPPNAPTIGTASAGTGLAIVTFTPGNLNSGTLVNHHATCAAADGPAFNGFGTSSPIVVTGLLAGTAYRCWVRTTNNLGTSPWSAASNFVTPTGAAPTAPTIGTASVLPISRGLGQVAVTFTPGNPNGGAAVRHHATCAAASGPAFDGDASLSPIVVSGAFSADTPYRCWVRTVTSLGTSPWSGATNYVTPIVTGPPSTPSMGTATAGPGQVSVAFLPGNLNGGVLTHHHVTCTAASGPAFNGYGSMSPIVVAGLTSGTPYRCWARTVTNLGTSAWSGASNYATPTNGPPAAPMIGMATAGAAQVSVAFTPGSLNGGVLTHHHVTCAAATGPAYNGYGASSPIVVSGLATGTAYRCWARTVTNLGTGAWSGASNFATPTDGPPAAPIIGMATAGNGELSVAFTPGSLNGGALTHHHVTCAAASGPAFNGYGMGSPIVVSGLTGGTAYRCWARTVTNMGTGAWSAPSNWATPT